MPAAQVSFFGAAPYAVGFHAACTFDKAPTVPFAKITKDQAEMTNDEGPMSN
jgi:hypothetical protein